MPAGRPTSYRPEYCETVVELAKEGKSVAQMCAHFDIARSTIDQWAVDNPEFSEAFARARVHMQARLEQIGFDGLTSRDFNASAWKTTMAARFRDDYTDRQKHEHSGPDGEPIRMEHSNTIADLPAKKRALLRQLLADGE